MVTMWSRSLGDKCDQTWTRHPQSASVSVCLWAADTRADWLTDSPSGTRVLLPLKCWNLRIFIVVWKGSLPLTQETEWLPCSKNARFPGPIPRVPIPAGVKTSPALETRDAIFLFLFFFFLPRQFQEVKQELQLFLRSWLACYPDPDLMFRFAVTSWALQCVTHAEDKQLAAGQGRVQRHEAECMCVSSFVCSPINAAISCIHSHISKLLTKPASGLIFCWSRARGQWRPCWLGNGMFEQYVLGIPQSLPWGFCLSEWTHIFIYRTPTTFTLLPTPSAVKLC